MARNISGIFRVCCIAFFAGAINQSYALQFSDRGKTLNLTSEQLGKLLVKPPNSGRQLSSGLGMRPHIKIDDMCFSVVMSDDGQTVNSAFTGIKWPNGIVYYQFDSNVSSYNQQRWLNAAKEWSNVADLTFTERTTQNNYIRVGSYGGNWSYVGMTGRHTENESL